MDFWISGCMSHGDFQVPLKLIFSQFILGIVFMAFKYRLYREKFNLIYILERLCQFLKGREPHPAATRSPILKKIQKNHLTTIIF